MRAMIAIVITLVLASIVYAAMAPFVIPESLPDDTPICAPKSGRLAACKTAREVRAFLGE